LDTGKFQVCDTAEDEVQITVILLASSGQSRLSHIVLQIIDTLISIRQVTVWWGSYESDDDVDFSDDLRDNVLNPHALSSAVACIFSSDGRVGLLERHPSTAYLISIWLNTDGHS